MFVCVKGNLSVLCKIGLAHFPIFRVHFKSKSPHTIRKLIFFFLIQHYYLVFCQVSEAGVHRPHVGGIHGRSNDGSYSLVLAGGFEDEVVGFTLYYYFFYSFCILLVIVLRWLWSVAGPGRWVHLHRQWGSWPLRKQTDWRALFRPNTDPHEQVRLKKYTSSLIFNSSFCGFKRSCQLWFFFMLIAHRSVVCPLLTPFKGFGLKLRCATEW